MNSFFFHLCFVSLKRCKYFKDAVITDVLGLDWGKETGVSNIDNLDNITNLTA